MTEENTPKYNETLKLGKRNKWVVLSIVLAVVIASAVLAVGTGITGNLLKSEEKLKPNEIMVNGYKFEFNTDIAELENAEVFPHQLWVANALFGERVDVLRIEHSCPVNCGHTIVAGVNIQHKLVAAYKMLGYNPSDAFEEDGASVRYMDENTILVTDPRIITIVIIEPERASNNRVFAQQSTSNPKETIITIEGTTEDELIKSADKLGLIALTEFRNYKVRV